MDRLLAGLAVGLELGLDEKFDKDKTKYTDINC